MLGLTAEQLGTVLTGFSLFIIWALGGQKVKEARAKQSAPGETFEVAGALVSDRAVREWIAACDDLTKAIDRNTVACEAAATSAKEASDAMDVLTREIIRKH